MATKLKTFFANRSHPIARMYELIEDTVLTGINFHIAGGSAMKLYMGYELDASDIDIWFPSREELNKAIAQWKSQLKDPDDLCSMAETDNSLTFSCVDNRFACPFKVQFIAKTFTDNIAQTIEGFDFTVCQVAYKHGRIYMTPEAHRDLGDKILRTAPWFNRVLCHSHMRKYMLLGFTPTLDLFDRAFVHGRDQMTYGSFNVNNSEFYDQ